MSAMVTISSVMALGYLNVMFCMMVWHLSDNMDKWFDRYGNRKSTEDGTTNEINDEVSK